MKIWDIPIKAIIFVILFGIHIIYGGNEYKNEIGLVFGIPDMINIKYQRNINNVYFGINSGFNPSKTIFIPALYCGLKIIKINKVFFSIEMINAYWPEMEELLSPYYVNNSEDYLITDWFHTAIRPVFLFDINKIRIAAGAGVSFKSIIQRDPDKIKYKKTELLPSCLISGSYIF